MHSLRASLPSCGPAHAFPSPRDLRGRSILASEPLHHHHFAARSEEDTAAIELLQQALEAERARSAALEKGLAERGGSLEAAATREASLRKELDDERLRAKRFSAARADKEKQLAKLIPSDGGSSHQWFGHRVAISGDRIVVSAAGARRPAGVAYIFDLEGNELQQIAAYDAKWGDHFGWSVAISNDHIVVGAATNLMSSTGSAYVAHLGDF